MIPKILNNEGAYKAARIAITLLAMLTVLPLVAISWNELKKAEDQHCALQDENTRQAYGVFTGTGPGPDPANPEQEVGSAPPPGETSVLGWAGTNLNTGTYTIYMGEQVYLRTKQHQAWKIEQNKGESGCILTTDTAQNPISSSTPRTKHTQHLSLIHI